MNKQQIFLEKEKMKLYEAIQRGLKSKLFQYFVLAFILLAMGAVILSSYKETVVSRAMLYTITHLASFVFLIEYVLRLVSAPAKNPNCSAFKARMRYAFSFYGFVDFIAILPFLLMYLYWNIPLRHMIVLLPYIFIIFKLIRYSRSFQLIGKLLGNIKNELITAYAVGGIIMCFSAILMYYIERDAQPQLFSNIGQGFWWAMETFTTVGYGDIYPVTPLGKLLGGIISLVGIGMIAIPSGLISMSFITTIQKEEQKKNDMNKADGNNDSTADRPKDKRYRRIRAQHNFRRDGNR